MSQPEVTKEQQVILDEIAELVKVGEQKLKQFADESAAMEIKWLRQVSEQATLKS
jgi:hypothetical protein